MEAVDVVDPSSGEEVKLRKDICPFGDFRSGEGGKGVLEDLIHRSLIVCSAACSETVRYQRTTRKTAERQPKMPYHDTRSRNSMFSSVKGTNRRRKMKKQNTGTRERASCINQAPFHYRPVTHLHTQLLSPYPRMVKLRGYSPSTKPWILRILASARRA